MKVLQLEDYIRGWFVGNFEPTAWKTPDFEVGYRVHSKGTDQPHTHTTCTEINLVTSGKMIIQDKLLVTGDIFILRPWEISNAVFLEDTGVVCVKVPSINDKKPLDFVE
jgi:hypothetical protein